MFQKYYIFPPEFLPLFFRMQRLVNTYVNLPLLCSDCANNVPSYKQSKASNTRNNLTAICFLIKICGEHTQRAWRRCSSLRLSSCVLLVLCQRKLWCSARRAAAPFSHVHPPFHAPHSEKFQLHDERPPTTVTRRINLRAFPLPPFTSSTQRKSIQSFRFYCDGEFILMVYLY